MPRPGTTATASWAGLTALWRPARPPKRKPSGSTFLHSILAIRKRCSTGAIGVANAESTPRRSPTTSARSSASPAMPVCSTTSLSHWKRSERSNGLRRAIATSSPGSHNSPTRCSISLTSATGRRATPRQPRGTSALRPAARACPRRSGASARWARTTAGGPLPPRRVPTRAPGERLRVAFVSANFRDHATMHLSDEFFEKIDRSRLEMFAYSLRPDDDKPFLRRAKAAFEHFADVSQDSVAEIAQRIREERIGILIDRNGYTLNAREAIFPLRPAPIQINCIGFPGTLGAPCYDYIFTDRFSLPEPLQRFYTERPLYMPHMAFPSDTTRLPAGAPPSRAACGLPEDRFVFCCFNSSYKILPDVFAIWMRLLAAVPNSVLWLLETSNQAKQNLRREAQHAGIDPARIVFAPVVPVSEHVARDAVEGVWNDQCGSSPV